MDRKNDKKFYIRTAYKCKKTQVDKTDKKMTFLKKIMYKVKKEKER